MTIRRVAVVMNGKAGALLDSANSNDAMRQAFAAAGLEPEFIAPEAGTLPERIQRAAGSSVDAVVVAGGDGTVACAAKAMAGKGLPLAILPYGTMNLLAKDLALPIGDVHAALAVVAQGCERAIDVADVNGHVFLCASMLGMPARLGRTREASRGSGVRMWSRMAGAAWRQVKQAKRLRMTLMADERVIPTHAAALTITVNPVDEASGRIFGRTVLDGGQFGVYIVPKTGLRALFGLAVRLLLRRHNASLRELLAQSIDITSRDPGVQVMNDGELSVVVPPLRYRIQRGALRVVAPAL